MEQSTLNPRLSVRRMCRLTVLVSVICYAVSSFVLAPIYIQFASNIVYAEAWWVYLLYYLTEEGLIDLVVFAVCYPATMYAVWQAGLKQAIRVPVAFSLITLGKFLVNFFMTSIVDGALPTASEFLHFDLPYIGALYVLEILQYALVIGLVLLLKRRYENKCAVADAEALLHESKTAPSEPLFRFNRLLGLKNPVQLSAFLTALLIFIARVIQHQIYQYTLYVTSGYTDGLFIMVLDLISDLFIAVMLYFAALLLLSRFYRKDCEAAAREA